MLRETFYEPYPRLLDLISVRRNNYYSVTLLYTLTFD